MAGAKKQPTFEQGLNDLESIAERMERSDLPLEELMKLYKEGMALTGELTKKLEAMKAGLTELRLGKDGKAEPAALPAEGQTSMDSLLPKEGL